MTDVDDKIIKRARRNKLIADFVAEHAEGFAKAKESVDAAVAGRLAKLDKALAGLKAAPPAEDAEDKVKEEWETEVKETALKLEQATFTAQRVATVADAVSGGVDKILADLEAKAKECVPSPSLLFHHHIFCSASLPPMGCCDCVAWEKCQCTQPRASAACRTVA